MNKFNRENINNISSTLIGIYLIKNNITNKYYVGQSIELRKRLSKHLSGYCTKSKKNKYPLYKSMNKHGIENFTFKILFSEEKDINKLSEQRNKLNELEQKYIIEYNSYGNTGYNQTLGSNSESGKGTFGYKYTDEQKENLSRIQKQIALERDDPYYTFNIETKECLRFQNVNIFMNHIGMTEPDESLRRDVKRNKCGFGICRDKYILSKTKEGLKEQIIKYIEFKKQNNLNPGQFQEVVQNVYCYNYILKCYYTFYSVPETIKCLSKSKSTIYETIKRESRSDDGWIISLDKDRLEEIKINKHPSKKVLNRYKTLEVNISTYPNISISIENKKA